MSIDIVALCPPAAGTAGLATQYRELLADGRVVVQGCAVCGSVYFPPLLRCAQCGSVGLAWWDAGTEARVVSWTTTYIADSTETVSVPRQFRSLVPYRTVVVEPVRYQQVRLACLMPGAGELAVGAAIRLHVRQVERWWLVMGEMG